MKVINQLPKVVSAGRVRFVPATPVECDIDAIKKLYPAIDSMLKNGELKIVSEEEAQKSLEDLEEKTVAMLRKIAVKKGIDVKGLKKADIIKALLRG